MSSTRPLDRVRVGYMPFLSSAPLVIGRDRGYFRDEGIALELVNLNANDAVTALASDNIEVYANILSVGMINAATRGARIAIVADKGHTALLPCPADGFVTRNALSERDFSTAEGLRGLRIGVRKMTTSEYVADRLIESRGVRRDEVTIVDISTEASIEALRSGAIDLRADSEPGITRLRDLGIAKLVAPLGGVIPEGQWSVIAFGPQLLEKNRELGRRFLRAYLRGVAIYLEGKTAANLKTMTAMTEDDPALFERSCWPAIFADGHLNAGSVADFVRWTKERGYVADDVNASALVDTSFLDEVRASSRTRP